MGARPLGSAHDVEAARGVPCRARPRVVSPAMVAAFARATASGDPRVARQGRGAGAAAPGGGDANGGVPSLLLASLASGIFREVFDLSGVSMVVNYGLDTLRTGRPCPTGEPVGCTVEVRGAQEIPGGVRAVVSYRFHPLPHDGEPPGYCCVEMVHQIRFGPAGGREVDRG